MEIFCKELNKTFPTKQEMFTALKGKKEELIGLKKSEIKTSEGINLSIKDNVASKGTTEVLKIGDKIKVAMNTTNYLDHDGDLIIDNLLSNGDVINDGKMNLTSRRLTGDIVNSGFLTIRVDEHVSGSIINSGIMNGEINGIRYGSWDNGSEQSREFTRPGSVLSSAETLGYLTIDTSTDTINSITSTYTQTNAASRQYDSQIVDADNATIYFEQSNADINAGVKNFDSMTVVNALPVAQTVNLLLLQKRTGASGLITGQCIIEFTRIP